MLKLLTYYFVRLAANNIVKKLKQFVFCEMENILITQTESIHPGREPLHPQHLIQAND
jgi:hypothetical protein